MNDKKIKILLVNMVGYFRKNMRIIGVNLVNKC